MRSIARVAITVLATLTLSAASPGPAVPAKPDDATIQHVLNRLGFGARPGDIGRVREMGLSRYIDQQLRPQAIQDPGIEARLAGLTTLRMSSRTLAEEFYIPAQMARNQAKQMAANEPSMAEPPERARTPEQMELARKQRAIMVELSAQKILRAAYSERQLEEVMTDFWFNHFNVFAGKGPTQQYLTEYERDVIRPRVLGRFRDLLEATAKSPAMLFYLDNWQSADPGMQERREQMRSRAAARFPGRFPGGLTPPRNPAPQRQARGLNENYGRELMELHTLGVDGGYSQQDVVNVARAFTGWTIDQPRRGGSFRFDERMHDGGEKIVLGQKIKAGGGESDGERVLDILAAHPSTAKHLATKLARRFVADTPPPALVDRAAARFLETHGDIGEVVRLIVTSPEFFSAEAQRAKVKTPFEFVVSAVRATGSDVQSAEALVQQVRQLGMPLYMCQPPTGYADRAEAWVNTGALLNRMNFALQLVGGRMRGVTTGPTLTVALAGPVSPATTATIAKATGPTQIAALTLGSPEFQRR